MSCLLAEIIFVPSQLPCKFTSNTALYLGGTFTWYLLVTGIPSSSSPTSSLATPFTNRILVPCLVHETLWQSQFLISHFFLSVDTQ